ncbi:D-Ala-D-Ala carboxypeptidase family metallohydrolase [Jiella pelagia]|uniref:D-Ala-D-Ala carboxypeptidase family metallohydrolase n=1 Tax=Jiella pelagia TaxID=2986949 RepID=A0ABY7C147_9HYPH|nr:D-Ala-D-Ala carboxypeptidase family metallohydrolase [Jiella pelagia]WAP69809.1 D-Ala-D-Ala carboxypeptidase family metallohydrolase [Jiella pelagia]
MLTSVYWSPDYKRSGGGARRSQHMDFRAVDFKVGGAGRPEAWARTLKR